MIRKFGGLLSSANKSDFMKHGLLNASRAQEAMDLENKYTARNYAPTPLVAHRGERIYLWDIEGKKYMDFMSGHGSTN